jgi:hypothetical protein
MKSLGYRLFRAGRMPAALATAAAGGGVLLADEGVPVKFSSRGLRAPGRYTARGVRLHVGAIVLTSTRVMVSIGRSVILDCAYGPATPAPLSLTVDAEAVHLRLDVGAALPGGGGTIDITVRAEVTDAVVAGRPSGAQHASLSAVEATALTKWA